tara:strand:- start:16 stop:990 length:975 start_codon:yes stop_codon:yes gene_type:complete
MNKIVAITIGDINGIGIDILINTYKKNKINNFILFTNINKLKKYLNIRKIKLNLNVINKNKENLNFVKNKFNVYTYKSLSSEDNTYKSLKFAYNLCINKFCIGIITLPLRKDLIKNKIDKKFIGHTEYFQKIDNKKYANMVLYHKKIIVSPITTHIPIKNISKFISNKNFLYNQIYNLYKCLKIDFNFVKPKIVISGLNPHAGENGNIGNEEKKLITPTIKKLKNNGINIDGPVSADSILINKSFKKYNCFIFIYHDQALIPFKFISQFSGVNYTSNLNIIRTSPDHGTANNLVGSKNVSSDSLINCYKLIKKINKNRNINGKS